MPKRASRGEWEARIWISEDVRCSLKVMITRQDFLLSMIYDL